MAATCASCRLNQQCNEIYGLMLGLLMATQQYGGIPDGTGGTIGLARQNALQAIMVTQQLRRLPNRDFTLVALSECEVALRRFAAIAVAECGPGDVAELERVAAEIHWASWRVSMGVYGRFQDG